jgi:hypothetical protein
MFRLLQTGENKMNIKNNQKTQNTLILLLILTTLSVLALGCSSSNTPPNNPSPSPTPTVEKKLAENSPSPTPTPKNPAEAFYGEWETKDKNSGNFQTVKFGTATQKGNDYVGTYTDVNTKKDLSEYTVKPNNTLTLLDLPGTTTAGQSFTFEYEVSGDGNTITLKSNPPTVFRKGTSSADILKDVNTITTGGDWKVDNKTVANLSNQSLGIRNAPAVIKFLPGQKVDAGYTGLMVFFQEAQPNSGAFNDMVLEGKFTIGSKDNVKINLGSGDNSAKYTLLGDNVLRIEFVNGDPPINLTR